MLDLEKYKDYLSLIEDVDTLQFKKIDNVTDEILKNFKIYEIDFNNKVVYLELKQSKPAILITSSDDLELPLYVAKNLNEAAEFMKVTATHLYRAYRNAGKPQRLKYNNFILYFLII